MILYESPASPTRTSAPATAFRMASLASWSTVAGVLGAPRRCAEARAAPDRSAGESGEGGTDPAPGRDR